MINQWSYACGSCRYQLSGNMKTADDIRQMARVAYGNKVSLYDAQESIKQTLCEKYGADWYESSGEAVQHIIEDAYASKLREAEIFAGLVRTSY